MNTSAKPLALLVLPVLAAASVSAATLHLGVSGDSYVRRTAGSANYGSDPLLFVADTATTNDGMRTLLSFDLSSPALVGATINGVTLTMYIHSPDTGTSLAGAQTIQVYQLNNSFSEGTVTWGNSSGGAYNSTKLLSSAAGDASTVVANQQFVFATSENFQGVVSTLASEAKSLNLLLRLATEDTSRSVFRFSAGSGAGLSAPAYRPQLTIDYTPAPIPEPSAFAILAGLGALGFTAAKRRARR